jgi:anti-sigma regulatory factor (Ser/Thr protein kinase)
MTATMPRTKTPVQVFRHEALLYAGEQEFLAGTVPFIRDAVAADEPILVVVGAGKIARLREALDGDAGAVSFADMEEVGENPARIIPAWRQFVSERPGRPLRGIGEPIWPGRSPAELVECHRHESLLNLAFSETPGFWLLCPYDTQRLAPAVVAEAHRTHPNVRAGGVPRESASYGGIDAASAPFGAALPEPAAPASELAFDVHTLWEVRAVVGALATDAMSGTRVDDLMLAVSEVAANSVRHGGGMGVLRVWREHETMICEVRDRGRIADPLAGRRRPGSGQIGGYGLWLANQVCDLVQVRTFATGGVVRLHMRLG